MSLPRLVAVRHGRFGLRMLPVVGREFTVEETRVGGPQAIIISDSVWRSTVAADTRVLGQIITLNDAPFAIVGVLPANFWFPQPVDVLVPLLPTKGSAISSRIIRSSRV